MDIDIGGPSGNAFALLGIANRLSDELNLNSDEIINEMQSGDYENLLSVFNKYFGHVVTLVSEYKLNDVDEDLYELI